CGPCRQLGPVLDELAGELAGKVKIVKMNVDDNPHTPSQFGIRSIPTMILFKGGQQVASKVGAVPKAQLHQWLTEAA
ncbi:MAG: thiol reductase thioredoxin, partial [Alphaproteobacteria bacterium]|nr:thiol reductase thioredoxin [Alphaproteobacteria bacterium]